MRSARTLFLIGTALALIPKPVSGGTEPCPTTTLSCAETVESSALPLVSASCRTGDPYYGSGSALADHPVGHFSVVSSWEPVVVVDAADRFLIDGIPAGTSVPLSLVLEVTGLACGGHTSYGWATLVRGDASDATQFVGNLPLQPCQPASTRSLVVSFTVQAGVEFDARVVLEATPSPGGRVELSAFLRLVGLPSGAQARSCKGFLQDAPVPARTASWGSLKSIYR